MRVSDILKAKGATVHSVRRDETVEHLAHRLRAEGVGAMIVSDNGATVDGIVSERDIVLGLTEHGGDVLSRKVADLMTKPAVTCAPDDTLAHVAKVMTQRRIRHLPVLDAGRLAGIVSIGDVVKHRMDELEMESNVLRDYAVSRH
jgi:CBS domain-containing protein